MSFAWLDLRTWSRRTQLAVAVSSVGVLAVSYALYRRRQRAAEQTQDESNGIEHILQGKLGETPLRSDLIPVRNAVAKTQHEIHAAYVIGDFAEVERALRTMIGLLRTSVGETDIDFLSANSELAASQVMQGKLNEGLQSLRETIQLGMPLVDACDACMIDPVFVMTELLWLHSPESAFDLGQRFMSGILERYGENNANTAKAIVRMAHLRERCGDLDGALEGLQLALAVGRAENDTEAVVDVTTRCMRIFRLKGAQDEARDVLQELLVAMQKDGIDPESNMYQFTLGELATLEWDAGRLQEARAYEMQVTGPPLQSFSRCLSSIYACFLRPGPEAAASGAACVLSFGFITNFPLPLDQIIDGTGGELCILTMLEDTSTRQPVMAANGEAPLATTFIVPVKQRFSSFSIELPVPLRKGRYVIAVTILDNKHPDQKPIGMHRQAVDYFIDTPTA